MMMKSQDMIANESIFGGGGQGDKETLNAEDTESAEEGKKEYTSDSFGGRHAALVHGRGKQQIPSDRVGTRKDRSSPFARDDNMGQSGDGAKKRPPKGAS